MLVLETRCCVVVSSRIPKAPARDSHALVFVLADGDLSNEFVTRHVELRLDLLFDPVSDVFGEIFELVSEVGPLFYPFVANLV